MLGSHYSALEKEGQRNEKAGDMQSPLRRDTQAIEKSADEGMGKRSKNCKASAKSNCIHPLITIYFRREKVLMTHTCGIHLLAIYDE